VEWVGWQVNDHPQPDPQRIELARFDRTYQENWLDVFRLATAWTNDRDAAEDIAQDTFIRLWRHRGSFDWDRPALPWLLVTARRLAASRFRALRRLITFAVASPTIHELTVGDAGSPGMDRWIDTKKAMARLAPRERTALVAVELIGLSTAEAGDVLGVSDGAVRALISRARRKLGEDA
jgi:RNA polymerase sigma-70 factor (ECF subfamily)